MNRYSLFTIGLMLAFTTCSLAQNVIKLEIYHTNDMHSRIEPFPKDYEKADMADKAGFVRRVTFIEKARKQDPDLLLFDCGDFSQGSPYYNLFKGSTEIEFMNLCKYDAATIGNHEFDFGKDNMKRIFQEGNFPFVCANYTTEGTVLEGIVKPYTILYRKGLKIGVFGLGPKLEGLVQEKNYQGIIFLDPINTANEMARRLKEEERCDLVICLSHLGWFDKDTANYGDKRLASETRNIDVILGGHTHTYMTKAKRVPNLDGKIVPVTQMGKNGQWIGHLTITLEKK